MYNHHVNVHKLILHYLSYSQVPEEFISQIHTYIYIHTHI
jgi:hypothetical protein